MLSINSERLLNNLRDLARIGGTPDGGVSRPAMSAADVAGRNWFAEKVKSAGFDFHSDGAGNLSAIGSSSKADAKTLIIGSHLDSVPDGGRYDGALGVLVAFEVLQTIAESKETLPFHLEVISFTDEEGAILGLLGSQAITGQLTAETLQKPRSSLAEMAAGMQRLGITPESILAAKREPNNLLGFIELHIEQGTRLEEAGIDIGVVTSLVGIRSFHLFFKGEAAHAGTMPMDKRRDALWGAADFTLQARQLVMDNFSPGVVNCGQINAKPGAFNIVPGDVQLALEFRHGSLAQLEAMESALIELAHACAKRFNLDLTIDPAVQVAPAIMDDNIMTAIEGAADKLNLKSTRLMSFAGHDTQAMSKITPSGMFFVPSVNGISHNPKEYTHDQDVINGANVMLQTVLSLR